MLELNRVHNSDCVAGLSELSNVDLIVADPPYVVSRKSNFHTMKDRKKPRTGTMLANWDMEFDNGPWIAAAAKALRPGGSLIAFNAWTKATVVDRSCSESGLVYKDTLVFQKTNPQPRNRERRYAPDIEMIQWFVKPGKWTFNRQNPTYERCVLKFPSESGGGFKRYHPTQKPIRLIEYLISIHSNEGNLVVDPFMGSGTTALASRNLGRTFVGFEINTEHYQSCCERIAQTI